MDDITSTQQVDVYADAVYQTFRATDCSQLIRIPVVKHPSTQEYYVIWTDITQCFPRVSRIQHDDVFVTFMRDQNLYRVRPHGIRYHPGVVLDVIYNDQPQKLSQQNRKNHHRSRPDHSTIITTDSNNINNNVVTTSASSSTTFNSVESALGSKNGSEYENKELTGPSSSSSSPSSSSLTPTFAKPLPQQTRNQNQDNNNNNVDDETIFLDQYQQEPTNITAHNLEIDKAKVQAAKEKKEEIEKTNEQGIDVTAAWQNCFAMEGQGDAYLDFPVMTTDTASVIKDRPSFVRSILDSFKRDPQIMQGLELPKLFGETVIETETEAEKKKESVKETFTPESVAVNDPSLSETTKSRILLEITHAQQRYRRQNSIFNSTSAKSLAIAFAAELGIPSQLEDDKTLNIPNIVRRRVSSILKRQYKWVESTCPKLFILLPVCYATLNKTEEEFDDAYIKSLTWSDFTIHYLCDCGNIPGFETKFFPHWNLKDCPWGHPINKKHEESVVNIYGDYLMAILEAWKYGVFMSDKDGDVIIPPAQDEMQKPIALAIKYLSSLNVSSSKSFLPQPGKENDQQITTMTLDQVPPVNPLAKEDLASAKHYFSDSRLTMDEIPPVLTAHRDVRWVCLEHSVILSPFEDWIEALSFCDDPASTASEFKVSMGAFRATVTTRERVRDYYRLAQKLTTTSSLRLFLDWDLTMEDEEELRQAVAKFPAACVKLVVRELSRNSCNVPGFEHGYSAIVFEALKNPKIEAFALDHSRKDEVPYYGYDEWYDLKQKFMPHDSLARFRRSRTSNRINMRALVTDIDQGMTMLRKVVGGLDRFTKLRLIISSVWENLTISLLKLGEPGSEIRDTEYETGDVLEFFEKRGNLDSVTYNSHSKADNQFIKSKVITDMSVGYVYSRDRIKIRQILKNNRRLKKLELDNLTLDDPSQIFESYKSLMANHPTMETLEVKQRTNRRSSDFTWHTVANPALMTLIMTIFEGDKVSSVFQKYASSLKFLHINGITASDAAVLEKVLRPKKGPFKLENIVLCDVHLFDPAALEDLRKVVTRGNFKVVKIYSDVKKIRNEKTGLYEIQNGDDVDGGSGAVAAANGSSGNVTKSKSKNLEKARIKMEQDSATKFVDFLVAIGSKVTGIGIWESSALRMLEALEARGTEAAILPSMATVTVAGSGKRLMEHYWFSQFLFYKSAAVRSIVNRRVSILKNGSGGSGGDGDEGDKDGSKDNSNFSHMDPEILEECFKKSMGGEEGKHIQGFVKALYENPEEIQPIRELSIQDFEFQKADLEYFLRTVDFSRLRTCRIDLVKEISGEALINIAAAIPDNCMMESFTISVAGPNPQDSLLCQQWIRQKCSRPGKRCVVLINGHL
ncbi:hypothetical protein BGZ46_009184 [Entomortierella lignicola]|nr:hypothetical protein BGZ46_009184 [Entomortierella lignicola]